MRPYLGFAAAALLMLAPMGAQAVAAEGGAHVKVALLDVSSVMPMGMAGYGMMGPGWGQGQGMMGQGQGMMGQGWGPGMMGPGMMGGMMSVRIDQATLAVGAATFEVTNWSRSVVHELVVVAVDNPSAPLPYDYAQAQVPEDQVKVLGEVADLQPNGTGTMELTLAPGSYLLICNLPGHYAAGMAVPLVVTP